MGKVRMAMLIIVLLITLSGCNSRINFTMVGQSMEPNIKAGDTIKIDLTYIQMNNVHKGDIVAYKMENGKYNVKRVIGLPGDVVEIKNEKIYLNNKELQEDYINSGVKTKIIKENKWTVAEGKAFILGDNREYSQDSRWFGPITYENVVGKVIQ